jgi:hypothetical protein
MATRRTKTRESSILFTEFVVPLAEVVAAFVNDPEALPGDTFSAQALGDELVFTRHRRTVILAEPESAPTTLRSR